MKSQITREQRGIAVHALITVKGSVDHDIKPSIYKGLLKSIFLDVLRAKRMAEHLSAREIAKRAAERRYEADIALVGHFCIVVWSRDCDMVETTRLVRYESVEEYYQSQEDAGDWAEGPVTWTYISIADAEDFQPHERDLIMENRENGGDGFHLSR
jgi:hypothetical protein